jgi:hypothetical protein
MISKYGLNYFLLSRYIEMLEHDRNMLMFVSTCAAKTHFSMDNRAAMVDSLDEQCWLLIDQILSSKKTNKTNDWTLLHETRMQGTCVMRLNLFWLYLVSIGKTWPRFYFRHVLFCYERHTCCWWRANTNGQWIRTTIERITYGNR